MDYKFYVNVAELHSPKELKEINVSIKSFLWGWLRWW